MIFNSKGQCLAGVAGVNASIDKQLITLPSGRVLGDWCWRDGSLAMGQVLISDGPPEVLNLRTSDDALVDDHGAYFLAASGTGAWATEHQNSWAGYWGSGVPMPRPCAGGNGYLAVINDYQAGLGLIVYRDDGSTALELPNAQPMVEPRFACRIHDGLLTFRDGTLWRLFDLATATELTFLRRQDGVDWLVPGRDASGGVWLFERDYEGTLTLRAVNSWTAYVVAQGPSDERFSPDFVTLPDVPFRCGWSRTEAQMPNDLNIVDVTDLASRPTLDTAGRLPVVPPVQPPVTPPLWPLPDVFACQPTLIGHVIETGKEARYPLVGNCSWSDALQFPRNWYCTEMLDIDPAWTTGGRPLSHGLVTTEIPGFTDADLDRQIAATKAAGAFAIYAHVDNKGQRPIAERWAAYINARGLLGFLGTHIVGQRVPQPTGTYGINLNIRDEHWHDPSERRKAVVDVFTWMAMATGPQCVYIFGWPDCTDEELKAWIMAAAKIQPPRRRPGEPIIVTPPPVTPPTPPKLTAWQKFLLWLHRNDGQRGHR